ncbi:MAG: radical SAM protein [Oscillospiraceae bacterium]|nr:radical SAM protein [Oscillospiraceae bacterium]
MQQVPLIPAKTIISRVKAASAWFGAEYNMNIYRGCSHGCIYCDSRSDCYRNHDFDTVKAKENALELIRDELRRKVQTGVIATGSMSDPYNLAERDLKLTRHALELIHAYDFGVAIATKSALAARDGDVLQDIKSHSPTLVKISITTADDTLASKIEPHVSTPTERFEALRILAGQGIYCGVLMMPVLPFLEDTEENVLAIIRKAKEAGAKFVFPAFGMTLRPGNREYYYRKLDEVFPGVKEKHIKRYGDRYQCTSPHAKKLWSIATAECVRLGLLYDMRTITRQYKAGYGERQLTFL